MPHMAAIPNHLPDDISKPILTFIVPAPNGCNLSCPYCFISKRKEAATKLDLSPEDYVAFIEQIAAREEIGAICLQGYEPLLPESYAYTRAILDIGHRLDVPTSLVTNGTNLEKWVDDLAKLRPSKLTVSIDAADPATHDRSRGKAGAHEAAMNGLRLAAANPVLQPVLTLASILMPHKHERLLGMPSLAAELCVDHWVVTALQEVDDEELLGPVGDRRQMFRDLVILRREAKRCGIDFVVDDEFGRLADNDLERNVVDLKSLRFRRLAQPAGTFRLLPTGQCSMGLDIMLSVKAETPRWRPGEIDAFDFIEMLRGGRPALSLVR